MVLTKMQSAIVDLINSMPLGAGKSHLVAYLYVNDENAKSIVEDWAARRDNKESPENSPAAPVQQAKDAIKPADYEYCPHCHGSFSFAKLGSDFKCKWCKKDVRTSGRLA